MTRFGLFSAFLFALALHAAQGGELRFALPATPKTFDPLQVSEGASETIRYLTGGVLLRVNRETNEPEPELAESWEVVDGGRTIRFHLRAGLKFSDGSPLAASDVARTLKSALDPKNKAAVGELFRSEQGDPEVRVVSPLIIEIRYVQPKARIDRVFDSLAITPAQMSNLPASAGPFHVCDYQPGQFVRLERNPNYWKRDASGRRLPYIDFIHIDIQPNREIEVTRFLRGELDLINRLEPDSFERITKSQPAAVRNLGPSLDSEFIWFNQVPTAPIPAWKKSWFTSTAFRRAVSMSIHRDDIARIVYRSHAHAAVGPVSPANRFWFNAALKPLGFDLQAALKLLASDGFTLRDGVLRDHEGHEVEFSIVSGAGNRPREAMAAVIQDDLKRIGIRVNIVVLDFGSLIERITRTSQYEAALLGFDNIETDPAGEMNVWLSSGEMHAWRPNQKSPATAWEARIDKLELTLASGVAPALRKKAFDEVQQIVVDQQPFIYLVNPDYLAAVAPVVQGTRPVAVSPQLLWNVEYLRLGAK